LLLHLHAATLDETIHTLASEEAHMSANDGNYHETTLVLGGTGKTGSRVARRLAALGRSVRVGSRRGTPPFDWDDEATWERALADVGAAYVSYYPDVAIPGAADRVDSFVKLALKCGVRRLVLLSGRGEDEAQRAERVVQDSGADWTIVRASWFAQNFSESFLVSAVQAGEVVLPVGDIPEPFVDVDDIADVAVAALTEDGHAGQLYEVTGPRMLTFADAVAEIAAATGQEIRYVQISPEAFKMALSEQGLPADLVWLLDYLFATVLDGRNAFVTDGVERVLGRPPRDFSDYARDTAASGVWNAPSGVHSIGTEVSGAPA
jgi:uncharacterized protein YbjT (DUF2867 family)